MKNTRKMKSRVSRLLLFAGVIMCLSPSVIQAETIRFAAIDYCPFSCDPSKEEGKEGFMTEVLREAFKQAGYTLEIDILPYVRAVEYVQNGEYDGIVVVGKKYAPDLVYPDEPTAVQRVMFLVNQETSWRYTGVKSLSAIRVGIVKGFHYVDPDLVDYLEKEQRNDARVYVIHGHATTARALGMLQTNRITTFLEGEYSAMYELRKMGKSEEVSVAGHTSGAFEDYTGFSPHNRNAALYAQTLSDTLKELKQSGRLNEILSRYGITPDRIN